MARILKCKSCTIHRLVEQESDDFVCSWCEPPPKIDRYGDIITSLEDHIIAVRSTCPDCIRLGPGECPRHGTPLARVPAATSPSPGRSAPL